MAKPQKIVDQPMRDREGRALAAGDLVIAEQPRRENGRSVWIYGRVLGPDGPVVLYAPLNPPADDPDEVLWSEPAHLVLA